MPAIISAAEVTDAVAIHPGYGFLSENAEFAERVREERLHLHRPEGRDHPPDGRQGLGHERHEVGLACPACPAPTAPLGDDADENLRIARDIGYPVIIKASGGGGGRGMRVVHTEARSLNAIGIARAEARAAFGNDAGLHGEVPRAAAAHRVPGPRRQPRQRRPPRRARLLDAAPPPEGDRGGAGPGHHRASSAVDGRALRRGLPRGGLPQRRHARVPLPGRRVLLHRDEHPHPGRAPGDRDGHRHRPGQGAAADRRRRARCPTRRATCRSAATPSSAASTPRTRKTFMPSPGPIRLWHAARRARHPRRQPRLLRLQRAALLRLADRQADRPRRHARHGDRAHAAMRSRRWWSRASRPTSPCTRRSCSHAAFQNGGTDIHYLERRLGLR